MNTYTVSFFGHRQIDDFRDIENRLKQIIFDLVMEKEFVEFLVGRDGEFDLIVSSVIREVVSITERRNTAFVLVLPYMRAEYRDNEKNYLNYYDEVEVCEKSSSVHFKAAIQLRNKCMVDRSDLVVCCIQHNSGGAYNTVKYAQKKNCKIINVANF